MKKYSIFVVMLLFMCQYSDTWAQNTQYGFSYQAKSKDSSGGLMTNALLGIQISIVENSTNGSIVFREQHQVTTNESGMFQLNIGEGTNISGNLLGLEWTTNRHYLIVDIDENGGTNYSQLAESEMKLHPAFSEIKEYVGGTGISIVGETIVNTGDTSDTNEIQTLSVTDGELSLSNGGGTVQLPASTSVVQVINQANHNTISIPNNSFVQISGTVNITTNFNGLNSGNLLVNGGVVSGTGSEVVEINDNTIIGTHFSNVILDNHSFTTFINCTFSNCGIDKGNFENCFLTNCYSVDASEIETISNSSLTNCNFQEVTFLSNSELNNCILGQNGSVLIAMGNNMDDCLIYLSRTFTGNQMDYTSLILNPGAEATVSGNVFDDPYSGYDYIIWCDINTSSTTQFKIDGNNFYGNSNNGKAIDISGNYGGSHGLISITDNNFSNFEYAITTATAGIKTAVNNNTGSDLSEGLGVSSLGTNLIVRDNDIW